MLRKNKVICPQNIAKKAKGQSTIEYIILVAVVIAAILIFGPGAFNAAFTRTLSSATDGMENMAGRLNASRP